MSLMVGGNKSNGDGIFINERTIVAVENKSGEYDADVTIKLFFESIATRSGGTFEPNMMLFGRFAKDGKGEIAGWGSAFKIERLLSKVGRWNGTINTDGTIPDEALECLIGKTCIVLQYPGLCKDGKVRSQNYQMIAAQTEWDPKQKKEIPGGEWLRAKFDKDVADGYVRDLITQESKEKTVEPANEEQPF